MTTEPDDDDVSPAIVAICPVSPELAAQIVAMSELDWEDSDVTEAAMTAHGWKPTGGYLGDLGEYAYTPAGHLVYGDDCFAMPFAYDYWLEPGSEDSWEQPGWRTLVDPPPGTFAAQLEAAVATFTALIGPPDHDVTHEPRPEFRRKWRYRAWRRGNNVLIIAPGLDAHSYWQFEHAFVQIRALPATSPFPSGEELPNFCW